MKIVVLQICTKDVLGNTMVSKTNKQDIHFIYRKLRKVDKLLTEVHLENLENLGALSIWTICLERLLLLFIVTLSLDL